MFKNLLWTVLCVSVTENRAIASVKSEHIQLLISYNTRIDGLFIQMLQILWFSVFLLR